MSQGLQLLSWRLFKSRSLSSFSALSFGPNPNPFIRALISLSTNSMDEENLPARERRRLRNERRESKALNWREEVEQRLMKKPKKRYASWMDELNLDDLALLGPQWWGVRVSRVTAQYTAERLAVSLARNYPELEFKVYVPAVQEKRKLKNGSYTVKSKPLFPGCVFLRCTLNKDIHDFVREYNGVGGFIGSKVGNTKRQINKPRPVSEDDMEAIFQQAKEEQEQDDRAVQDEQKGAINVDELSPESELAVTESRNEPSPKQRSRKASDTCTSRGRNDKLLKTGSTVRVLSGPFAEFSGVLKKLDRKNGKATVGFTLFGKETIADLEIIEIMAAEE